MKMDVIKKIIAQQIDEIPSVNKDTLILSLMNMKGSNFISFVSHTQPKMKKTGNIYANKIVKISNVSANVGFDYESGVNRRREKEGKETDFQSKSNWHEPVINNGSITALSRHCKTGELYLRCNVLKSNSVYVNIENGEIVEKEALDPFLQKTDYKSSQGLDDSQITFNCYKLDSIKSITFDKKTFKVV